MRCGRSSGRARLRSQIERRALLSQAQTGALQGLFETLPAERLQQVVHGVGVEGAHGVLVVGGDENHHWAGVDQLQHFEAVQFGHLDVQEEQIGASLGDGFDGFEAVGTFRYHLDIVVHFQHFPQETAGEFLVVHDDGA